MFARLVLRFLFTDFLGLGRLRRPAVLLEARIDDECRVLRWKSYKRLLLCSNSLEQLAKEETGVFRENAVRMLVPIRLRSVLVLLYVQQD